MSRPIKTVQYIPKRPTAVSPQTRNVVQLIQRHVEEEGWATFLVCGKTAGAHFGTLLSECYALRCTVQILDRTTRGVANWDIVVRLTVFTIQVQ